MRTGSDPKVLRWAAGLALLCLTPPVLATPQPAGYSGLNIQQERGVPSSNFRRGRRGQRVDRVVIHTIEGRASGAISWFKNPRAKVSAHYIVDKQGRITQMLDEGDTGYHCRSWNNRSIGLEHEGYADRNQWTDQQMRASAALTRAICDRYRIPVDRTHIVGHVEVPGNNHHDPGRYFDWTKYIAYVRQAGSGGQHYLPPGSPGSGGTPGGGTPGGPIGPGPYPLQIWPLVPLDGDIVGVPSPEFREGSLDAGYRGLQIMWGKRGTQTGYQLQLSGSGVNFDTQRQRSANDDLRVPVNLQHKQAYRWRLQAWGGEGNQTQQIPWQTFSTDFTPPVISGLSPAPGATTGTAPLLRWTYSEDDGRPQRRFRIHLWKGTETQQAEAQVEDTFFLNGGVQSGEAGSYLVSQPLESGQVYSWRVMVEDGVNTMVSKWQQFTVSDAVTGGPAAELVYPQEGAVLTNYEPLELRWRLRGNQEAVRLVVVAENGTPVLNAFLLRSSTRFPTHSLLQPGTYRWRLQASDGESASWSDEVTFRVRDDSPVAEGRPQQRRPGPQGGGTSIEEFH